MLIQTPTSPNLYTKLRVSALNAKCNSNGVVMMSTGKRSLGGRIKAGLVAAAAAAVVAAAVAAEAPPEAETLENVPQTLSGECVLPGDCKRPRIQRPKSRKAESCTSKCVTTCIQGGDGSPGEGPFNVRRPIIVFKEGFRSRKYCLVECSDICNLIRDGDDGP